MNPRYLFRGTIILLVFLWAPALSQSQTPLNALPNVSSGARALNAPGASPSRARRPMRYEWFWNKIAPDAAKIGPERLEFALASLIEGQNEGRRMPVTRMRDLQTLAERHGADVMRVTSETNVSPLMVLAVMSVESAGRANAVSPAGAQGLMQLMPATARRFGVSDSFDPLENISGGVAYLDFLMRYFERDPILVLAGYNAGENAVRRHRGVPPFSETRDYVPQVLTALYHAQNMCSEKKDIFTELCASPGTED